MSNDRVNANDLVNDMTGGDCCPKCGCMFVVDQFGEYVCQCGAEEEQKQRIQMLIKNRQSKQVERDIVVKPKKEIKMENQVVPEVVEKPVETQSVSQPSPDAQIPQMPMRPSGKAILKSLPGAPGDAEIEAMKAQWGQIYVQVFSEKEVYVWRYLNYREWQTLATNEELMQNETKLRENIVMRAVLWPKFDPVKLNVSRAGLISTLYGVIMQGSYFLDPGAALNLCEEL